MCLEKRAEKSINHHFKNYGFLNNDSTDLDDFENIREFKKLFDEFIDYRLSELSVNIHKNSYIMRIYLVENYLVKNTLISFQP